MDPQSRKFTFVINNPHAVGLNLDEVARLCDGLFPSYYCLSEEIGAENGTPHIHGFIMRDSPLRFSTLKNRFPIAHIEHAYGTAQENRDYIAKTGKWADTDKADTQVAGSFREFGTIPEAGAEKAPDKANLIGMIDAGLTDVEIVRTQPKFAFRIKEIDTLRQTLLSERFSKENRDVNVTYLYGDTGSGKTSSIFAMYAPSEIYRVTNYGNGRALFDNYTAERILVFEEFHSQIRLPEMLSYLDIYPLQLPARFFNKVACFTEVFILSNLPLQAQYTDEQRNDPSTWAAFLRRIGRVLHQISPNNQLEESKEVSPWE